MDITQHINSVFTVIITMVITIAIKGFLDWATNKNGKEALKELKNNFDTFKIDDLNFKNKLLQDLNEFKYKYTGREVYDTHINSCTLKIQEYKEDISTIKQEYKDELSNIKQEIAVTKSMLQTIEQRLLNLEK